MIEHCKQEEERVKEEIEKKETQRKFNLTRARSTIIVNRSTGRIYRKVGEIVW
jgi:hypothetical protein